MARIVKKTVRKGSHRDKYKAKYSIPKNRTFYLIKNSAGETIKSFTNKRDALAYSKKRRGV